MMLPDFDIRLESFIDMIRKTDDARMSTKFPTLCVNGKAHIFYGMTGKRYVRIVRENVEGGGRSVHCFVDSTNGDILKAAGWKAPAKHARGNIYSANPMEAMSDYGAKYLK